MKGCARAWMIDDDLSSISLSIYTSFGVENQQYKDLFCFILLQVEYLKQHPNTEMTAVGEAQYGNEVLSDVEKMAKKIEERRDGRIKLTKKKRTSFLTQCSLKAKELNGGKSSNILPKSAVVALRDENESDKVLKKVFEKALQNLETVEEDTFYYRDFNQYDLQEESHFRAWVLRNPIVWFGGSLFTYFLLTSVFFCDIMKNEGVCSKEGETPGWMTAIYFAAATISTVGYGDVSVMSGLETDVVVPPLVGIIFMCISLIYAVTAFSALLDQLYSNFDSLDLKSFFFGRFIDTDSSHFNELPLHKQLARIKVVRMAEIFLSFLTLNLFGMFIVKIFVRSDWSWMTSFYWAVQTTTTIGYGDLTMPEDLRWFNIFYTLIGTGVLANILGRVANLKTELREYAILVAWKRRQVSKRLIQDMEGDNDGTVDQYEFLVASLVTLEMVSHNQIREIMVKFKELAGDDLKLNEDDIRRSIELNLSADSMASV